MKWEWPYGKKGPARSIDWRGLPSSPTSFCIFPIRDEAFSPKLMVLLVYNHADKGKKSTLSLLADRDDLPEGLNKIVKSSVKKKGKPAGYGMPGGGLNHEWLENMECTAIRESGNESGIRVIGVRLIPVPGKKNKALIMHKKTGELIRWVPYSDDQQVSLILSSWDKVILNPMNYYIADIDWFKSKAREFLLNLKEELVAKGCTKEDIAHFGISINTLTMDQLITLNIHREEVDEIGGFALLPVRFLREMSENKRFYLDPEEDRENRLEPTSYIYKNHVERILQGLDIMGVG